jgi:hypothetical protein
MKKKTGNPPSIKPSHKGRLHRKLHVPMGQKIPAGKLQEALNSSSQEEREEAQYAQNAKQWNH